MAPPEKQKPTAEKSATGSSSLKWKAVSRNIKESGSSTPIPTNVREMGRKRGRVLAESPTATSSGPSVYVTFGQDESPATRGNLFVTLTGATFPLRSLLIEKGCK